MNTVSENRSDLYRTCVGQAQENYYVPLFERFDDGESRISWNWPAAFITFFWLLYRRMYVFAAAYLLLLPVAAKALGVLLVILAGKSIESAAPSIAAVVLCVLPGMFANALYHFHVNRLIDRALRRTGSHQGAVEQLSSQYSTTSIGTIVVLSLILFVAGVVAVTTVPPIRNYHLQYQVSEGLALAEPIKEAVDNYYDNHREWLPVLDIDTTPPSGRYVSSVDVSNGLVLIHYGNYARSALRGRTLALRPAAATDRRVQWVCGYASHADGLSGAGITDIPAEFLPAECRAQGR